MVERLEIAFQEQDKYVLSIIRYILVKQGAVAEKEKIDTYLEEYRESSIYGYDIVEITNKKILRKIKKERSNDFE